MSAQPLHVIALISGGKDSFFSLAHCLRNGHRVVALANLYPPNSGGGGGGERAQRAVPADKGIEARSELEEGPQIEVIEPNGESGQLQKKEVDEDDGVEESDLNSFMYQTVGHQIIPLYAQATGLPLYRRVITGGAAQKARDYDGGGTGSGRDEGEETESMTELLKAVMKKHPDANAVCAGAILSTYQRTRVESVATRLGLVPLAYLWKYPILPPPKADDGGASAEADDAQLLLDMAVAGLDARIVKVASAGLDEAFLWTTISGLQGIARARRALRHFDEGGGGAILGEGGEFETIVVDGPAELFKGRIVVEEDGKKVVREGGGCSWLRFTEARAEAKDGEDLSRRSEIRVPELLDERFAVILDRIQQEGGLETFPEPVHAETSFEKLTLRTTTKGSLSSSDAQTDEEIHWGCIGEPEACASSIEEETSSIVERIRNHLGPDSTTRCITNTLIVLRHMSDFPAINKVYGTLFPFPNPPSRVTISCGNLLPAGHNIAVYITYRPGLALQQRNGLHVQSRSYWAPANIGPYSQAIDVPVSCTVPPSTKNSGQGATSSSPASKLRLVAIAGQIPLIPATMELPEPSDKSLNLQVILSLQHLWRIGVEMQVQLWTSAVAYFPRTESRDGMLRKARLAAKAWRDAHVGPKGEGEGDDNDSDEGGPDLWDRKYNPEYMTFGDKQAGPKQLPDWDVFGSGPDGEPITRKQALLPPFFAAEVEELPRQADIEWHAHAGLSGVENGPVQVGWYTGIYEAQQGMRIPWRANHVLVEASEGHTFLHTTISISQCESVTSATRALDDIHEDSLRAGGLGGDENGSGARTRRLGAYLVYGAIGPTDVETWGGDGNISSGLLVPFVPCRSIWDEGGEAITLVALFRDNY